MTEREAWDMLAENFKEYPRLVVGRTVYEVRPDGRVNEYTRSKSGKRMTFDRTVAIADVIRPDVRKWCAARAGVTL